MPTKTKTRRAGETDALADLVEGPGPSAEELLDRYLAEREEGKQHYGQADEALDALIARLRTIRGRKLLTSGSGDLYELVDNFAVKNVQFGHGSVRRFDLKPVKG